MIVAATIAVVAVAIAIGWFVDRRFAVKPEQLRESPKPRDAIGSTPATAIRASDAQLARLRTAQRCTACRNEMTCGDDDRVRYDDRTLLVLKLACSKCGAKRSLYVETTSTSDPQ